MSSVNTLIETQSDTRLAGNTLLNLYGLVVMAYAAVLVSVHKDLQAGEITINRALLYMKQVELPVKSLMIRLAEELKVHLEGSHMDSRQSGVESREKDMNSMSKRSIPGIPSSYFRPNSQFSTDWLISSEYEMLFFATTFIPFISSL